ncbi:Crp/Fnr family transcriptional regulator [Nonomuraea zeae]|uniref:Crp/Fnr family transcriptional regulator n=1 Tax=Nonomuraea zeae TaxID=1642303 RepID=A0A5S4G1U5_9ACTN|nr:helix-turn-helix domain-containing protein [Nonomuraea zeae]TMR26936.1 Crp/Fnr family transcriptional regulator [Nonomuraea zeae]
MTFPLPPRRAGQLNFWSRLSDVERRALMRMGTERPVFTGDTLIAPCGPSMTILLAGCWVRLQAGSVPTSRCVIDMAAPGDLVNALCATTPESPQWLGQMAEIFGVVLTKGKVLEISGGVVQIVLGDLPNILNLIEHLQNDQLHFTRQMHASSRLDVGTRLARLLLNLLYRFGERPVAGRNLLAPPLSQADLAAWVGASETSVGRVLRGWRADGLIHVGYSSLAILDPKAIRDLANSPDMPFARFPATRDRRRAGGLPGAADGAARPRVAAGLDLDADLPPGL